MESITRAVIFPILLPLGTTVKLYRKPWATYGLMLAILAGTLVSVLMPELAAGFLALDINAKPYQYVGYAFAHPATVFGVVMFTLNLYFLWVFGPPLENRIGWWRLPLLYVLSAAAGGVVHEWYQAVAGVPFMSAMGGVFGLIGAFMLLYPFSSVNCFFLLLVLIVPIKIAVVPILTAGFLAGYAVLLFAVYIAALNFGWVIDLAALPIAASLGGLGAGFGLAAALYGFHAFTAEADEEQQSEKRLQRKLQNELEAPELAALGIRHAGPARIKFGTPPPLGPELQQLHDKVIMGRALEARDLFARLAAGDPNACLHPGTQMDLFRLLLKLGEHTHAAEALERLLRVHPNEPIIPAAQLELARLLLDQGGDRGRAAALLQEFIKSQPPLDLEREARELLAQAQSGPAEVPVRDPEAAPTWIFDPDAMQSILKPAAAVQPESANEAILPGPVLAPLAERPQRSMTSAAPEAARAPAAVARHEQKDILGSLEDSEVTLPPQFLKESRPALPEKIFDEPPEEAPIKLSDSTGGLSKQEPSQPTDTSAPTRAASVPAAAADDQDAIAFEFDPLEALGAEGSPLMEEPSFLLPSPVAHALDSEDGPQERPKPTEQRRAPNDLSSMEVAPAEPAKESERPESKASRSTQQVKAALDFGVQRSSENLERERHWRDDTDWPGSASGAPPIFALILPPGRNAEIAAIVHVLAPWLGMKPESAHHALLRRRGILADRLRISEAEELATRLSEAGQGVVMVAEVPRLHFGAARDVLNMRRRGIKVELVTAQTLETCTWENLICIGAGEVQLEPGAPGRSVIDLLFVRPNRHYRIWENTFLVPPNAAQTKVHWFRSLGERLGRQAEQAIQTRTFEIWLQRLDARPPAHFYSLIEYDNYLRWHMLAYYGPGRLFAPPQQI